MSRISRAGTFGVAAGAAMLAVVGSVGGTAAGAATPGHGKGGGTFVYTSTNATGGNTVEVFRRGFNGSLTPDGSYATGGSGTGSSGLSQGSVTLSRDGRTLLVVDAGSDQVSDFAVGNNGALRRRDVVSSLGNEPASVAIAGGIVEVLNTGSSPDVVGFVASRTGLTPIPGGSQPLSTGANSPEDVTISPNGTHVVVTEKGSNTIDTFALGRHGKLGAAVTSPSDTPVTFASVFASNGKLLVADDGAAGTSALSVYRVHRDGTVSNIEPSVPDAQTAACWIAIGDGGDVFVANAGSSSISSYRVTSSGRVAFFGNTSAGSGSKPLDESVTSDGRDLYVLDGVNDVIAGFAIGRDGKLSPAGSPQSLPAGSLGLAAG